LTLNSYSPYVEKDNALPLLLHNLIVDKSRTKVTILDEAPAAAGGPDDVDPEDEDGEDVAVVPLADGGSL
jgi:hypothetical protein